MESAQAYTDLLDYRRRVAGVLARRLVKKLFEE